MVVTNVSCRSHEVSRKRGGSMRREGNADVDDRICVAMVADGIAYQYRCQQILLDDDLVDDAG